MSENKKSSSKNRRQRVDSAAAAVKIAQDAMRTINPPIHIPLEKKHLPFFDSIIEEFARSEWTNHQLEIAALLARAMCRLEEQQRQLDKEGPMLKVKAKKGKSYNIVNHRQSVVQQCSSTVLSMRRSLSLHARARAGEARDVKKRRDMEKKIEDGVKDFNDPNGLIARPLNS